MLTLVKNVGLIPGVGVDGETWPEGPSDGPQGPCQISSKLVIEHCSVILLKAPNQAEGLVRRFRGSQEVPWVTLQNLWIIFPIFIHFWSLWPAI